MKNSKKPNNARFPAVFALLAMLPALLQAFQLQDINLSSAQGQVFLKLSFSKTGAGDQGEYPLYFQKVDPSRGTLTLSFLDTETPFPFGRHAVETANPALEEVLLKRVTSPSGKSFLGVELRLKEPPAGEAQVQPQPKGTLKVLLGKAPAAPGKAGKLNWSLAQALKGREDYLSAKAEAPPAAAADSVPNKVVAQPAAPAPEAAPAAPAQSAPSAQAPSPAKPSAPAASAEAAPAAPAGSPAALKEIRMALAPSQEDVTLVLEPESATPVHTAQASPEDSAVLEVVLDGVTSSLPRKEYVLPGSGLFKKVRVAQRGGDLVLRFTRLSRDPVHVLPKAGGLTLTGAGRGESAVPFKWTTSKPEAAPPASAAADPVESAHEEGAALDAAAAGKAGKPGKGLSSSRTFSLGKGGKSMILLKDSSSLKDAPGPKAGTRKKLPLGEKVERIERAGAWIKVVASGDTGFIKAADAVYEDEMTEAQAEKLRKDQEAAAQAAAAAAARAEAQRAKAEAAAAAKEAAAAAKAAAANPPPAAEAEAVAEAEPVRVAGPGAAVAGGSIAAASAKASDGPKLSLAESPELAEKLAQEKKRAEEEKMRVDPAENRVAYNSYGRRDPFIPVEQGLSDNGIDIDQMKVVGIIWQAQEPMAVLEHNREAGVSFTVKQGDPVHNGRVSRITRDQVTFDISEYGISRSYSLKLVSNKEGKKQ